MATRCGSRSSTTTRPRSTGSRRATWRGRASPATTSTRTSATLAMASDSGGQRGGGALQSDVRPREVWAWAMYDFANSGYTTVVITAVFNAYFVGVVCAGQSWGTFAWTLALSASYAIIIF